jgi:hypothetical protein
MCPLITRAVASANGMDFKRAKACHPEVLEGCG